MQTARDSSLARQLCVEIREQNINKILVLLQNGANPNCVIENDVAPIHLAAGIKSAVGCKIIEILLSSGGDTSIKCADGLTPVHISAAWGCARNLIIFLRHGGDPDDTDDCGQTAWDLAKKSQYSEVLDILWEHKVKGLSGRVDPSNSNFLVHEYSHVDDASDVSVVEQRWSSCREPQSSCDKLNSITDGVSNMKLSSKESTTNSTLYRKLTSLGDYPGPVTSSTRSTYIRRLSKILPMPTTLVKAVREPEYSNPLKLVLEGKLDPVGLRPLEISVRQEFEHRTGLKCEEFIYLLLDPRVTDYLPLRADGMGIRAIFEIFLRAIFYVGHGKLSRPLDHLREAKLHVKNPSKKPSNLKKIKRIMEIWDAKLGVVVLQCFHNLTKNEACTREASMIDAIRKENLTNEISGTYSGEARSWPLVEKCKLGTYLLYQAMQIYMIEGERQVKLA